MYSHNWPFLKFYHYQRNSTKSLLMESIIDKEGKMMSKHIVFRFGRLLALAAIVGALLLVVGSVQAGTDVAPGQTGFEPNNAVVNPQNPSQVAVMRGCQVRISNNFGQTFPIVRNTTLGCNGDPSMAFDSQGRLFVSHLTRVAGELTVVAGQIADTVTAGTLNYTPIQVSAADGFGDDKQWLAADANPSSPFRDNLYLVWSRNPTIPCNFPGCSVLFSRSINQGATWSAPQVISVAGEGFVWPAHVAVGHNGDVYVAYHTNNCGAANAGTIPLLRDGLGGANFAAGTVLQRNNAFGAGQATVTCNVQNNPLAGTEIPGADFWLQGTAQPWILPDPARAGNVYVIANDDPNNAYANGDDADVVIARSSNNGVNFTRSRVDSGPGQSFAVMPTAHIDQDGNIAVHWYDSRRNLMNTGANANFGAANFLIDLYGTTSKDGGQIFTNDFRISDNAFDPDAGPSGCRFGSRAGNNCTERIGEYNGVWTVDGIGYAAWTGNATPPAAPFPSDGAGAQTTLFDLFSMSGAFPDRLEPNESIDFAVVAALGSDNTYNEPRLSLHSSTDVDFFKVVALHTGKLQVEIEFNEVIADLEVRVRDAAGNILATGTMTTFQTGSSVEMLAIPVVQGEIYFVEAFDPGAPNTFAPQSLYDLTIINRPAPVPFELDLRVASDSGRNDADDVTNDNTPTIQMRVDMVDAADMGIDMLTPVEVLANEDGYAVAVFDDGTFVGYASPIAGTNDAVWEFTFPGALPDGVHSLTAKVNAFDGATPQANGLGGELESLLVTIDTVAPAAPSAPDLLGSSDSGTSDSDNITNINEPAFQGTGEAAALVRIRADGVVVGEGVIGSDNTDGVPGNGLGAWEITVEPLADGSYSISAEAEDLAGNISAQSAALAPPLVIDTPDGGGRPQRPTLDLVDADDTGRSDQDNVTNLTTLDVRVSAEAGTTVDIKDGNTVIDSFVMPAVAFTIRTLMLAENPHPLSTESTDLAGNTSAQSTELLVIVDTTAPQTPGAPDLLASSDSGGIDDDDITTLVQPAFQGMAEANSLVRIMAGAPVVGQSVATSDGAYEITVEPLSDGVYNITAEAEDLAGNVSSASGPLKVTIANQVLNLPGATSNPANMTVQVDLSVGTVASFPGVASASGLVGIVGIPVVNLDVNGQALSILGTASNDGVHYTPTGALAGTLTRDGSVQVLNFTAVGGTFTVDPLAGSDTLTVNGTVQPETVTVLANNTTTVQVGSLKTVSMPIGNVELLIVNSDQSVDTIDVTAFDTVNAHLFVNAGEPTTNTPNGDTLVVRDGSGKARIRNQPGGPVPNSGSVLVEYRRRRTTHNVTRIDYTDVERVRKAKA